MKIMDRTRNVSGVIFISLALSSCTTAIQGDDITKPTHRHIIGVDCSGASSTMSDCKAQAKNMCPDGYTVISKSDPSSSAIDPSLSDISATNSNISDKRGMTILCN